MCVLTWVKDTPVAFGQANTIIKNGINMNVNLDQLKEDTQSQGNPGTDIELKELETRLGFLYDIAQQASSAAEVSDLLKEIPCMIQQILNASASSVLLIDEEEKQFCLRALHCDNAKVLEQTKLNLDSGIAGFAALNSQSVIVNDISLDKNYNKDVDGVSGLETRSIIAAPLVRGSKVIGVLEMINKKDGGAFNDRDLGLLSEFASTEALILLVSMATILMNNFKLCQKIQNDYGSTVETLVSYADAKDPYAHGHSRRVKDYSMLAANALKLSSEELKLIEFGALLHDIGKIGIDDRILRKSGTLTTEEWYIIRKHALKGANIVRLIPNLEKITDIILYHHEKYDGTGYPEGLKGDKIPLGARIIAVADAFDTMTTDRAYRNAMTFDEAISELLNHRGKQFCPQVVEAFVDQLRKQKETSAIKENKSAIEYLLRREIEEAVKEERIPVNLDEEPAPEEAARQDIGKGTKQETMPVNAEDNPAAEMILKQFVKEAAAPEAATANKESNLEAEAILKRFVEEATKQGGSAENGEAKSAAVEIKVEKPGEVVKNKKDRKLEEKAAKLAAKEKAKQAAAKAKKAKDGPKLNHNITSELYQDTVQLEVTPFMGFKHIAQFKKILLMVDGLRIMSESWSEDDGFIITLSLREPILLGRILQEMTDVEEVYQKGGRIVAVLKTSGEAGGNEPATQ